MISFSADKVGNITTVVEFHFLLKCPYTTLNPYLVLYGPTIVSMGLFPKMKYRYTYIH